MSRFDWRVCVLAAAVAIAGCATHSPAPVVERSTGAASARVAEPKGVFHTVRKGDTLFSIALEYGQDYKDVAAWNGLDNPNVIKVGQQLRVAPPDTSPAVAITRPVVAPAGVEVRPVGAATAAPAALGDGVKHEPKGGKLAYSEQTLGQARSAEASRGEVLEPRRSEKTTDAATEKAAERTAAVVGGEDGIEWIWPVTGKVIATFVDSANGANKGIDIAARMGEPVLAAAAGKVVYVGNGLRGYGNLVIVRHSASFLSAYAHNSRVLAKEGQTVSKGHKIAEVGNSDADQFKLHFEIRRQGKPVDPMKYLPQR